VIVRHQRVSALAENQNTAFILADARNVDEILDHPKTARLLDPGQPAAALYMTFLHFIPDADDPAGMIRQMMNRLAAGSYLALSHVVSDDPAVRQQMTEFALTATRGNFGRIRKRQEVRSYSERLEPVEPGLVNITAWRPDGAGKKNKANGGSSSAASPASPPHSHGLPGHRLAAQSQPRVAGSNGATSGERRRVGGYGRAAVCWLDPGFRWGLDHEYG
jgi:hypothetical protein